MRPRGAGRARERTAPRAGGGEALSAAAPRAAPRGRS